MPGRTCKKKDIRIDLDPVLGINPRLTFCPACGMDTQELVLLGTANYVGQCPDCGLLVYGLKKGGRKKTCPRCNEQVKLELRKLEEREKIPSPRLCDACAAKFYSQARKNSSDFGKDDEEKAQTRED